MSSTDKLVLYTNHRCPWAHRSHIALNELGIPFEEVIIDLDTPRTPEYLAINPRGLVPTLKFNDHIIPESGIVSQFLVDAYPSHLLPPSNTVEGALQRAKVAFFVDAFFSKFQGPLIKFTFGKSDEEAQAGIEASIAGLVKEVDPLLANAKPFFGGSEKLTLAEVLTGSFVIRITALLKAGVYPASFAEELSTKAPNYSKWAAEVSKHPSVTSIFDEDVIVEFTRKRIAGNRSS